jgi:hypothetical protein
MQPTTPSHSVPTLSECAIPTPQIRAEMPVPLSYHKVDLPGPLRRLLVALGRQLEENIGMRRAVDGSMRLAVGRALVDKVPPAPTPVRHSTCLDHVRCAGLAHAQGQGHGPDLVDGGVAREGKGLGHVGGQLGEARKRGLCRGVWGVDVDVGAAEPVFERNREGLVAGRHLGGGGWVLVSRACVRVKDEGKGYGSAYHCR